MNTGIPGTAGGPPPLRVAILIDSYLQPLWIVKILNDIAASNFAELALVVCNGTATQPDPPFAERLRRRRSELLYALYQRLDQKLFPVKPPHAFEMRDISEQVAGVPVLKIVPLRKGFGNYFSDEDVRRVMEYRPDVILRFGFGILRGSILRAPRFGVWSHHHGDANTRKGGPPGFWEVIEGSAVTGSMLQRLDDSLDNGLVLYKSFARTADWSVNQNVHSMYWKTAEFATRTLRSVWERPDHIDEIEKDREYQPYEFPLFRAPRNGQMAAAGMKLAGRYLRTKLRSMVSFDQWVLSYRIDAAAKAPPDNFSRFVKLIPPKDRFWADPFPIRMDGRYYLFYEELPYATGKGHLCAVPVDEKGVCGEAVKVLDTDCHLSYPFLFRWENNLYMMPETGNRKTVEVYRCERFPDVWKLDRIVMQGIQVVDSTLHFQDGLWWLFANLAREGSSTRDEMHLFYGESPLGPWRPHRMNPIRSDVRVARPAGKLFDYNGRLYRPAQDLSRAGAFAVVMNVVDCLSTTEYREHAAYRFQPRWEPDQFGAHTLNFDEGLTVIDLMLRRSRF